MRLFPILMLAGRVVLGGVMIYAGTHKILAPAMFAETVRAYNILPLALVNPFAVVVPWMEVIGGGLLMVGLWTKGSAVLMAGLLGAFGVAIGVNIARGSDMTCGCFGIDGGGGTLREAAVRDAALLVIAGGLVMARRTALALDELRARRRPESAPAEERAGPGA